MLYDEGSLSIEQAEQIIGETMKRRIEVLNNWCRKNGYRILLHSTFKGKEESIFSKGLYYPSQHNPGSRNEILEDSNIPEKHLIKLENWARKHSGQVCKLQKLYETYPPNKSDTVIGYTQITAKDLLEYNHCGGDITILLCVPFKRLESIGRPSNDPFQMGVTRVIDPYLRRSISCKQNTNGELRYGSKYFYPTEGILCAFDRRNNQIIFNNHYDESYYIDNNHQQNGTQGISR